MSLSSSHYYYTEKDKSHSKKGTLHFDINIYLLFIFSLSFYFSILSIIDYITSSLNEIRFLLLLSTFMTSFLLLFDIIISFLSYIETYLYTDTSKIKNSFTSISSNSFFHFLNGNFLLLLTLLEVTLYIGHNKEVRNQNFSVCLLMQTLLSICYIISYKIKKYFY